MVQQLVGHTTRTLQSPASHGFGRRRVSVDTPPATCPEPGEWAIDAGCSRLRISVKVGFVATVTGRFSDVTGVLHTADDPTASSVSVRVRTASLTSGSSYWDTVLVNAGLVDTRTNPTIAFESTGVRPGSFGWRIAGSLRTHRGDLPVDFDLQCPATDLGSDSDGAERIRLRATGAVASKDAVWLLSQPGLERLVGKTMNIDLAVEAIRV